MLDVEPLLLSRLATVPGLLGVHSAAELTPEGLTAGRRLPAAFVAAAGWRVLDAQPRRALVAVTWLVVVAVANAARAHEAAPARAEAGPLVRTVFARLLGWQPSPQWQPLAPAPAAQQMRPEYLPGVLLWPMAWDTAQLIEAQEVA